MGGTLGGGAMEKWGAGQVAAGGGAVMAEAGGGAVMAEDGGGAVIPNLAKHPWDTPCSRPQPWSSSACIGTLDIRRSTRRRDPPHSIDLDLDTSGLDMGGEW